ARPSGRTAPRPSLPRWSWSARSDADRPRNGPGQRPGPAPPDACACRPAGPDRTRKPPPAIPEYAMLDENMKTQLAAYLERLREPIELNAALDDSEASRELRELLQDIAALSDKVSIGTADDERRPSFEIRRAGTDIAVRFAGLPMGHEFTSLVLALLHVGGHPPREDEELLEQARALQGEFRFETYFSLS